MGDRSCWCQALGSRHMLQPGVTAWLGNTAWVRFGVTQGTAVTGVTGVWVCRLSLSPCLPNPSWPK